MLPKIILNPVPRSLNIGDPPPDIEPNVHDDCILVDPDGTEIGLFIRELPVRLKTFVDIADAEILTKRVPKSEMRRSSGLHNIAAEVKQYSTILGSCPPKPHMRRPYASRSSVHSVSSARTFVKAMNAAGSLAFEIISEITPSVAKHHYDKITARVPEKWRFSKYFSSTISNCNIAAPIHQDHANVKGAVNIIITKRRNSTGGNLHVPDYNVTFNQIDGSMLVYPAWRNMHGVTPIKPIHPNGYRNSHVWYALDSFANL